MEEDSYGFLSLEDAKKYLTDNYPDKMILEKLDDYEMGKKVGAQELANEIMKRMET